MVGNPVSQDSTEAWKVTLGTRQQNKRLEQQAYNHRQFTGAAVAVRKIVNARQMAAARLIIGGVSAYRALTQVGYSRWTARNFGALLRSSWGLREAIRLEQESQQHYLRPAPARRRRYDRQSVAKAVLAFCGAEDRDSTSNVWLHKLYLDTKRLQAIAEGRAFVPLHCSVCRGLTEGQDLWCHRCQRVEPKGSAQS